MGTALSDFSFLASALGCANHSFWDHPLELLVGGTAHPVTEL